MPDRVEFTFDGRTIVAAAGTSVAAAAMNAGITALRTSVSGQPRGALCGMGICFECRVTIDGKPHQRSCMAAVVPGMVVRREP